MMRSTQANNMGGVADPMSSAVRDQRVGDTSMLRAEEAITWQEVCTVGSPLVSRCAPNRHDICSRHGTDSPSAGRTGGKRGPTTGRASRVAPHLVLQSIQMDFYVLASTCCKLLPFNCV